ncbi:MAG TPA: vWA domain-containing protein [Drouetiella sp.]
MFHAFNDADKIASLKTSAPDTTSTAGTSTADSETSSTVAGRSTDPERVKSSKSTAAAAIAIDDGKTVTTETANATDAGTPVFATPPAKSGDTTYAKLIAPSIKIKNGKRPNLDIAFCIDTTSSMQGEIDTVKAKVKSLVTMIAQSKSRPIVRVGLVAYRDIGDNYVTKEFPFSADINGVVRSISDLMAEGGGDGPEAVERGLHAAITNLDWSENKQTAKLLFLIGDAPPHAGASIEDLKTEIDLAATRNIHINTIACDGLQGYGEAGIPIFKQISQRTNGNFEQLAYYQEIADTKGQAATLITVGGKSYVAKSTDESLRREDIDTLVAKGIAAPSLQGATNGTIGVQGSDATYITGVNTAGTVRENNNLDNVMLQGAQSLMTKMHF